MNIHKIIILNAIACTSLYSMQHTPATDAVLETERLYLRPLTLDDAAALLPILGNTKVMAGTKREPMKIEEVQHFLKARIIPSYKENGWGRYAFIRKDNGELIGFGGLNKTTAIDDQESIGLGIVLAEIHHGKGYAREVAQAGIKAIQEKLPDLEITAAIDPENKVSVNLAVKNGFKFMKVGKFNNALMDIYKLASKK